MRSSRWNHITPLLKQSHNFSAGSGRTRKRFGNHRLRFKSRLTPISRIATPNTVLTPGIETGIRKTRVKNAVSKRRPSCPSRSLISANVTLSRGKSAIMTLSLFPGESMHSSSCGDGSKKFCIFFRSPFMNSFTFPQGQH